MEPRPPTARPKTSAGSRATSARLHRPSNNAVSNNNERPVSRAPMASESSVVTRTGTRAGIVPPSRRTTEGEKARNRISTVQGARPTTGANRMAPPGTTMRPITQQGLTGVRPPTKAGSGRFVVDKSYYISLLRAHMNNLVNEIKKLSEELEKCEQDRQNLLIYEKKAEEEASIIRELQGRLVDCNKIVDLMNTNSELDEMNKELNELQEQNVIVEKSLNELFEDRRLKEEAIQNLEKEIEEQKTKNGAFIHSIDPAVRETYEQMKRENEELLEEYQLKQEQLNELNRKKEQLDEELANNPLKQQAMMLHERLAELEMKKQAIVDELNAEGSPEEQRERLLQTVTRTTNEINTIQKQLDGVNEQIEQANEELREFDSEFVNVAGEKSEKYRNLKLKEMQMDEFLDSYDSLKAEEELRIDKISTEVIRILELISANITNMDFSSELNHLDFTELQSSENASISELKDLHVRLQEELIALNELEERLEIDSRNISERMNDMAEKMKEFENIDGLKLSTEQKRRELEHRREMLEQKLPEVEKSCENLSTELNQAKYTLNNNDEYVKLKNAQKKWQYVEQSTELLREMAAQREAETNYQPFKEKALQLKAKYNSLLITSTRPF